MNVSFKRNKKKLEGGYCILIRGELCCFLSRLKKERFLVDVESRLKIFSRALTFKFGSDEALKNCLKY